MKDLIKIIHQKHREVGIEIHPPATLHEISDFEKQMGFPLPQDFREFYLTCNVFGCTEDIFNMVPLSEIRTFERDYGNNWFYFSEYMIYSDMWGLRWNPSGQYEIFNGSYPDVVLTSFLRDFLSVYAKGNVFEAGGLYDWHKNFGLES